MGRNSLWGNPIGGLFMGESQWWAESGEVKIEILPKPGQLIGVYGILISS